jgi:hypothetical protein
MRQLKAFDPALRWWLEKNGNSPHFGGCKQLEDGSFMIHEWQLKNVPQPTEAQIATIVIEYNVFKEQEATQEDTDWIALKTKLKLSDKEFQLFKKKLKE